MSWYWIDAACCRVSTNFFDSLIDVLAVVMEHGEARDALQHRCAQYIPAWYLLTLELLPATDHLSCFGLLGSSYVTFTEHACMQVKVRLEQN